MPSINASLVRDVAMCDQPLKTKGSVTIQADTDLQSLPLDLLLILDVSGSMSGEGISVVTDSMIHILNDLLGSDDRIAVITFNASGNLHCNWTDASGTVPGLSAGGGTNFGSAINEVLSFLGSYDGDGARAGVALFLSDGHGNPASDDNVRSIPDFGFTMHTIGVTSGAKPTHLEHMAELARGHYFDAPGFTDVQKAFTSIFNYGKTVIYSAPELEVEVMDGVELTNIVQSPQGIQLSEKMGTGKHSVALTHMLKDTRMEIAFDVEVGNCDCDKVNELASFSMLGAKDLLTVRCTNVETELYNAPVNNEVTLITQTAKAATAIKRGDTAAATRAITKLENLEKTVPAASTRTETLTQASRATTIGERLETLGKIQASTSGETKIRED
jgi:hypothetical protein